ncbi:MAG: 2Fe-2S iron-sulfur cluster binding domain-containing protein [Gammaproteobacteria bacterium]|nr:2Fe-2S iron-sulfur cluster binding domain-containing protein [Gammaproteobacteria bacterium]
MTGIIFEDKHLTLEESETVLDALLRAGHDIPNGCRAGICQSCIMKCDTSEEITHAQTGLSDAQKTLKYFLSCQCRPSSRINVQRISLSSQQTSAEVIDVSMLNETVIRLRLKANIDYYAGQYLTLWKDGRIARCYSLASHPTLNDYLEFHIKYIEGGKFSAWLRSDVRVGDMIKIQGPFGKCIYAGKKEQPLLLLAIGTGLSPIFGILQDAIEKKHQGKIHIVIGARSKENFYLTEELQKITAQNKFISLTYIYQEKTNTDAITAQNNTDFASKGDIYQYCKERFDNLKGYRVFICGAESFCQKMRKQCFLEGADMNAISVDSFISFTAEKTEG